MKPRTPNVEGMMVATPCQKPGMFDCGQLSPVMNRKGTEENTTNSITFSR